MPPIKKHIMDKQEQAATTAATASTNIAGPQKTPELHDHAQVVQEAASALKSLHDGESSESNSPASSKRSSAVATTGAGVNTGDTGVSLQAAVEAACASTSAASSSKKNKTTDDGSGDANADGGGSSNPKKRKQIDGPSIETAANNTTSQFDEEIPLTFPQRLMELLDNEGNDDIIGWLPHGRGFLIYQKRRFAAELMGKYFKQSKFTSFTRKLNRWGFTRISRGPETGAYYHPYFRKGNARLCLQMTCQSLKGGPSGSTGASAGAGGSTGAEVAVASNTAPPSMLQHQEASAASAQLAVPKAAQMQQSLQRHPITPALGLPNPSPMAAALASTGTTTTAGLSAAELLRTETATESVLRLRQLQRQQEQLMIRQRQIREEIQAISAALPEKIAHERRQQQVMAAAASSSTAASASAAAAGQAGLTMASAATANATPATQATPPSGSTGTGTAPAPSTTTRGQDPAYSKAIVDAAIETLKRSNANSYLTLLMARQHQQGSKQAGAVSGPIAPAPAMAIPAAATPATAAAANAPPTNFQSQLRQTVRAQLDQMRLAESQRRQHPVQAAQQAQQTNQAMEGITPANDGRLKAGPGALHPAQAAAQSGTYRSSSQGQKRPSGAKRASAA